ncbi:MAG: hypothetical protein EHM47_00830 [Ignavibacteriales bacterium]|nr:MAG: hypothetical protein EHM47_00830 [Ignavibacteriales bacterium]
MKTNKIKVKKLREQTNIIYDEGYQQAIADFIKMIEKSFYSPRLDHKRTEEVCIFREELKKQMLVES